MYKQLVNINHQSDETDIKKSNTSFCKISSNQQKYFDQLLPENYYSSTAIDIKVFDKIWDKISYITNIALKNNLKKFLEIFSDELTVLDLNYNNGISNEQLAIYANIKLPTINLILDDDNVFLDWTFDSNLKIGFTISEKVEDSTWFLFVKNNSRNMSVSDDLLPNNYYETIKKILKYVLENT